MAPARRLTRERILSAAMRLVRAYGPDGLTMRRLGRALGVDPTTLYRHFRNKDELLRALGDRILADVVPEGSGNRPWRAAVREICVRLRSAHLAQPRLAALAQAAPPRQPNELRLTEALLAHLAAGGFSRTDAAVAYHALIELTVGSATIDASMARASEEQRSAMYQRWRSEYASLDPGEFPESVEHARSLYLGSAGERFEQALDALVDGLAMRIGVAAGKG